MTPPDGIELRRSLAAEVAASLAEEADRVLGDRLRRPTDRKPEWDDWLRVSTFSLVERCARRAARPAQDYVDTAHNARRRVGLIALRRVRDGRSADLVTALRDALDDSTDWPRGLWDWVSALDPAGRAAVAAAALTWAASLERLLHNPAARLPQWADPTTPPKFEVPGRLVRLEAPVDATAGRITAARLLVVADGDDSAADPIRAGHVALVRTLQQRLAPVRVTVAAPARGEVHGVEVDAAMLEHAVGHAVARVAAMTDADTAPARVGRGCRHCHLLDDCPEGTAHVEAMAHRAGGSDDTATSADDRVGR